MRWQTAEAGRYPFEPEDDGPGEELGEIDGGGEAGKPQSQNQPHAAAAVRDGGRGGVWAPPAAAKADSSSAAAPPPRLISADEVEYRRSVIDKSFEAIVRAGGGGGAGAADTDDSDRDDTTETDEESSLGSREADDATKLLDDAADDGVEGDTRGKTAARRSSPPPPAHKRGLNRDPRGGKAGGRRRIASPPPPRSDGTAADEAAAAAATASSLAPPPGDAESFVPDSLLVCGWETSKEPFLSPESLWGKLCTSFLGSIPQHNYHEYIVRCKRGDYSWTVKKRFSSFYDMHKTLKEDKKVGHKLHPLPSHPRKTFMRQNSEEFAYQRLYLLNRYLQTLLKHTTARAAPAFLGFMCPEGGKVEMVASQIGNGVTAMMRTLRKAAVPVVHRISSGDPATQRHNAFRAAMQSITREYIHHRQGVFAKEEAAWQKLLIRALAAGLSLPHVDRQKLLVPTLAADERTARVAIDKSWLLGWANLKHRHAPERPLVGRGPPPQQQQQQQPLLLLNASSSSLLLPPASASASFSSFRITVAPPPQGLPSALAARPGGASTSPEPTPASPTTAPRRVCLIIPVRKHNAGRRGCPGGGAAAAPPADADADGGPALGFWAGVRAFAKRYAPARAYAAAHPVDANGEPPYILVDIAPHSVKFFMYMDVLHRCRRRRTGSALAAVRISALRAVEINPAFTPPDPDAPPPDRPAALVATYKRPVYRRRTHKVRMRVRKSFCFA